jgi:hypothetical protein
MKKNLLIAIVAIAIATMGVATQAQETKLAEGEILYRGTTKLEKCDEVILSFVLSAGKDTAKNFSMELDGVYIRQNDGSIGKVTSTTTYYGSKAEVKVGGLDYKENEFRITIKKGLGADIVTGEIKCTYEGVDLGTASIEFKKVQ